eukprot:6216146-Lingulodinium_polyedra.AAC.1
MSSACAATPCIDEEFIDTVTKELKGCSQPGTACADTVVADTGSSSADQAAGPSSTRGALEKALEEAAVGDGKFELRGTVLGNRWCRELKANPELKKQYEACHGRVEQQAFRKAWVCDAWKAVSRKRQETTGMREQTATMGTFKPVPVVIKEQGDDEAAKEGVQRFVEK